VFMSTHGLDLRVVLEMDDIAFGPLAFGKE
jgi:hypothetical protein